MYRISVSCVWCFTWLHCRIERQRHQSGAVQIATVQQRPKGSRAAYALLSALSCVCFVCRAYVCACVDHRQTLQLGERPFDAKDLTVPVDSPTLGLKNFQVCARVCVYLSVCVV